MVQRVPVSAVGGTQDNGPWPSDVEEIAAGEAYNRPVRLSDGSVQELTVTVTEINEILDEAGDPTGGYVVAFQYDDPTTGGGL